MPLRLMAANSHVPVHGEPTYYVVTGVPEGQVAVIRHTPRGDAWQLLHWTSTRHCDWTSGYESKEAALAALATALPK